MVFSSFHSYSKYVLSTHYMSGLVLGAGNTEIIKFKQKIVAVTEFQCLGIFVYMCAHMNICVCVWDSVIQRVRGQCSIQGFVEILMTLVFSCVRWEAIAGFFEQRCDNLSFKKDLSGCCRESRLQEYKSGSQDFIRNC